MALCDEEGTKKLAVTMRSSRSCSASRKDI